MLDEETTNQIIDMIIHSGEPVTDDSIRNALEILQRMYKLKVIGASYE